MTMRSELIDSSTRRARGWLFYDAECRVCRRIARGLEPLLNRRDLAITPLQAPHAGALLGLSREELLREMRFLLDDGSPAGRLTGGADAVVALAREIGWARPIVWLAQIPGVMPLLRRGYGWIAAKRKCAVPARPTVKDHST